MDRAFILNEENFQLVTCCEESPAGTVTTQLKHCVNSFQGRETQLEKEHI